MNGFCKLCGSSEKLVKSHVVPEFMYRGMYDGTHRFFVINSDPAQGDRVLQKGLYEHLLCVECDGKRLSAYECYADRVIYKGGEGMFEDGGRVVTYSDVDYVRLRLFFLSVLWRMSVARHKFFSEVDLGPYEDRIRNMILTQNPGQPDDCGFLCVAPYLPDHSLGCWMTPPDQIRGHGRRLYRFVMGGLLYVFFVGSAPLPKVLSDRFLRPDDTWTIIRERIENIAFLGDMVSKIGEAIKEREMD